MNRSFSKQALLICMLGICMPGLAANLPEYYPGSFDRTGTVDQIDYDHQIMIVNDITLRIAPDLKVHTVNTRFAMSQSLKPGMKVGFGTSGTRAVGGVVSEVWVLPDNYDPAKPGGRPNGERRERHD